MAPLRPKSSVIAVIVAPTVVVVVAVASCPVVGLHQNDQMLPTQSSPSYHRTVAPSHYAPSYHRRAVTMPVLVTSPGPLAPNQPLSPTSSGIIRCYFQVQSKYRPSDVPPLGRQLGKKRKKKDERVRDEKRSILTLTPSHQATTFCFAPPACLNHMSSIHHSHCRFLLG